MTRPRRNGLVAAAAATAVAAAIAVGAGQADRDRTGGALRAPPLVLTLANLDRDPTNLDTPAFIAAVERLSHGSILVDERHGSHGDLPRVAAERTTIADVRSGAVDLALIPARAWHTEGVESFDPLLAPFLIDSYDLERRVLLDPVAAEMLGGLEPLGLRGVALLPGALRYPLGVTRAVRRPEDLDGAVVGMAPSGVADATLRALGARPQVQAVGELAGLDAVEQDIITIGANRYDPRAEAITANVVLWPRAVTIVMNSRRFAALTDEQQDVLTRAGREAIAPLLDFIRRQERETLEYICAERTLRLARAGPADVAALRAAVEPLYDELERNPTWPGVARAIEDLDADGEPAPDVLRCPDAPERAGPVDDGRTSPLDGRWAITLSRQELVRGGVDSEVATPLAGSWVLDLHDGVWVGMRSDTDTVGARATYTLDGDIVTIRWDEGVGLQPGQVDQMRWRVYRDALTFAPAPGHEPPLALMVKPFRRVD